MKTSWTFDVNHSATAPLAQQQMLSRTAQATQHLRPLLGLPHARIQASDPTLCACIVFTTSCIYFLPCTILQLADPWEQAQDMMLRGTVAEGTIVGFNKGGVLVDIGDLKGEYWQKARSFQCWQGYQLVLASLDSCCSSQVFCGT